MSPVPGAHSAVSSGPAPPGAVPPGAVPSSLPPISIRDAPELDRGVLREVAYGRAVQLDPALCEQLDQRRVEVLAALDGAVAVYGVTTGMGALSGHRLSVAEQAAHQRALLLARAVGGAPWLSEPEVRALFAVRLRTFLSGDAGVSAELCQALVGVLGAGRVPAVPRTGVGCAGEIIPLAHAFAPLAGLGSELVAGAARPSGAAVHDMGPKEGISLLAGVPGATALALLRAAEARTVAGQLLMVAAGAILAVGAPRDPYLPATARGDDVLGLVLGRLRELLADEPAPRMLQAPVSFRVVGPVLAQLERAIRRLEAAVDRALCGVGDSPAYLDGTFVGTAGFHGIDLAAQLDGLSLALAHAADVASAQLHRLLDERITGLNRQLATRPGPDAGLIGVHKRAAAAAHALRRAAQPSVLGPIETSNGQEDVQSFAWEAAEQVRTAVDLVRQVIACEALAVHQALHLRGDLGPAGLASWSREIAALVPPIDGDRAFGIDVEHLLEALAAGALGAPTGYPNLAARSPSSGSAGPDGLPSRSGPGGSA